MSSYSKCVTALLWPAQNDSVVKTATSHDLSTWLLLTQPPITGVFWQLHHFSATTSLRSAKTLSWCHTKLPSSQIFFILNYGSWVFEPKRIHVFCVIIHVNKKIYWAVQNGAGAEVQARGFLPCAQQLVKQSGPRAPAWALWSFPLAVYLHMVVCIVSIGVGWKGGSRGREHMYTYRRLTLSRGRNWHNIVQRLFSN